MSKAADYGQPTIRVRRMPHRRRWIFRRSPYEVEYTEVGAATPSWTRLTTAPVTLLRPFLGLADAHAVVAAADESASTGGWSSLFDEDVR